MRKAESEEERTEERTEKHACDCISRQAAVDAIWKPIIKPNEMIFDALKQAQQNEIETIPSFEPERKPGKWVHMVGFWECDQCHVEYTDMPTCMGKVIYEYCPMCGRKMEVHDEQV